MVYKQKPSKVLPQTKKQQKWGWLVWHTKIMKHSLKILPQKYLKIPMGWAHRTGHDVMCNQMHNFFSAAHDIMTGTAFCGPWHHTSHKNSNFHGGG